MHLSRPLWLLAVVYVVATVILLFLTTPHWALTQKLSLFYKDPTIAERVHDAIIINPNGSSAIFTRIFHNKITFILNTPFLSLSRSLDPIFFFSLFTKPYFGDSYYFFTFPFYFPFFLIGATTLIYKWDITRKKYRFLWYFGVFALFIDALFIPYTAPIKLLPLFISVQLIIFFGCYELYKNLKHIWVKK